MTIEELSKIIKQNYKGEDLDLVRLAYDYAKEAHGDQKRKSGEPYITHPVAVAATLADMKLALPIVIAGLLHDVPEDTATTVEDVEKNFGKDIAGLVAGVTKLGHIKYRGIDRYVENLRKMFLAMAADVRVIFIKFADRLHNLTTLDSLPPAKQKRIAVESLEIYAPIANRLGMGEMQSRIEDAAFRFAYPREYELTKKLLDSRYADTIKDYHTKVLRTTKTLMAKHFSDFEVQGRVKHLYSYYRKLVKHHMNPDLIYDLFAVRILLPTVADCYTALGAIHSNYVPLKGRIKDYISQPKPNGYKSLHTTVFCEDGHIVEFQIRTYEMHSECELGISAHWHYNESNKEAARVRKQLTWVKELAKIQEELHTQKGGLSSINSMKIDVFQHHIFVFTPQGDVIDLPEGSTPVDFAYAIHTDVGNHCAGARINNQLAPLNAELKNGDVVDIIIDKKRTPNPDWLKFVKTHSARAKIRSEAKSKLGTWLESLVSFNKNRKGK